MTTLSIGRAQHAIGAFFQHYSEADVQQKPGFLTRFAASAQVWAERYGEYKYNETDWRQFRF
jgi:hypothetical protein